MKAKPCGATEEPMEQEKGTLTMRPMDRIPSDHPAERQSSVLLPLLDG